MSTRYATKPETWNAIYIGPYVRLWRKPATVRSHPEKDGWVLAQFEGEFEWEAYLEKYFRVA